ncbi:MAG: Crp/Fnr family transcriptional regulator [Alphaproteobacteria bacterium]|nr:Crp/Fnr family transcriptional regulator [Alphaproteobacteria bacterium]
MHLNTALRQVLPGLPARLADRLAAVSGQQRIGKGSFLFRQGESPQFVYGLIEGRISLVTEAPGEESIAEFVEPGDVILLPPSLLNLPYMVSAKAVTDLRVVMIPAADFRQLSEKVLPLAVLVSRIIARQWRLLLGHLTRTKTQNVAARLTQYLIDNAGTDTGRAQFALRGTKKDLAAHLGVTPATLSRSLKRLEQLGVATSRSEVQIENVARLKRSIRTRTGRTYKRTRHAKIARP